MKIVALISALCVTSSAALAGSVRVAAIQCPSQMGAVSANVSNITDLVREAAARGAKLVVTPECAVQGYVEPTTWTSWTTNAGRWNVFSVAETVPGPTSRHFSGVCRDLGLYLCLGLIEKEGDLCYNSQLLIGPDGIIAGHHRKQAMWAPGDGTWCTPGKRSPEVVETPLGRLGMMICYDIHHLPKLLANQGAQIVAYSVGWYGPNEDNWFRVQVPRRVAAPNDLAIVAANWSGSSQTNMWPGLGHSAIISASGSILAMASGSVGNEIVVADIEITSENWPDSKAEEQHTEIWPNKVLEAIRFRGMVAAAD